MTNEAVLPEPDVRAQNQVHASGGLQTKRTCFCNTDEIAVLHANGDGLSLNGRGFLVANLVDDF